MVLCGIFACSSQDATICIGRDKQLPFTLLLSSIKPGGTTEYRKCASLSSAVSTPAFVGMCQLTNVTDQRKYIKSFICPGCSDASISTNYNSCFFKSPAMQNCKLLPLYFYSGAVSIINKGCSNTISMLNSMHTFC